MSELRDKRGHPTRVYYVVTSSDKQQVAKSLPKALQVYAQKSRDGHSPVRLEKFRLDARHLDGLLVYGQNYFGQMPGELLRECGND